MGKIYHSKPKLNYWLFLFVIGTGVLLYYLYGDDITIRDILTFTPSNSYLAGLFILAMFLFKSVSVFFSIGVIYMVSGIVFPDYIAIPLNIVGTGIGMTYSYYIGYFSMGEGGNYYLQKYDKLDGIFNKVAVNGWFTTFIIRVIGIIPHDIVGIILGSLKVPYIKYITASIIGVSPILIATTVIGISISNPNSKEFLYAVIGRLIIALMATILYPLVLKMSKIK